MSNGVPSGILSAPEPLSVSGIGVLIQEDSNLSPRCEASLQAAFARDQKGEMDFRIILALCLALSIGQCQELAKNETAKPDTGNPTPERNATSLPSLCTVCNCTGDIINCSNRGLKTHFEDSQWPNVSISDASFNNNSLVHLKAFPRLAIRKLILRHNQITKIDECAFKQLINLTELDLSHNQLTSELLRPHVFQGRFSPESYEPLAKLTVLNLGHNVLHSLHQSIFEHLSNLKVLSLAGNPFKTIDPRTSMAISNLMYLEELDLSYCELRNIPDTQFRTLRRLKTLNLSSNRFVIIPAAISEASALETLVLDENPITVIDHVHTVPSLPKLKELSLCCMPHLHHVGKGAFSGFSGLQTLRIKNSPNLAEIDEDALVNQGTDGAVWPALKKLDLSDNALRYLPALLVGRWDWLEELGLMNNKWSCDCENQYLIGALLPKYGKKLMGDDLDKLVCASPPEHEGKNLTSLYHRKLRCLDLYEAQPEKDAAVLVGMLIGLLLAIPIGLAVFVFWRRGFFFCGANGPASFSRAFYKRTANDDDL